MRFIKVYNKIKSISSKEVVFEPEINCETFLRRIHDKVVIWKLLADGIYVRKEYADAYKLRITP